MNHYGRCPIMIDGTPETASLLVAPWEPAAFCDRTGVCVTFRLVVGKAKGTIVAPGPTKAARWSVKLAGFGVVLEGETDTLAEALREVTAGVEAAQRVEVDRTDEGAAA